MDAAVAVRVQRAAAWCGAWYVVTILLGWVVLAGFLPAHQPTDTADRIASIFADDALRIRAGMVLVMVAALCMIGLTGAVGKALSRVEGSPGALTYSALLGGAANMCLTFYPPTYWLAAAYRADRDPTQIRMLNDVAWLQFVGGATIFLALPATMAVAAFVDQRPDPIFPRWSGYLNVWVCLLIIPDQLLFFFQTGPFTWAGLFGLSIPLLSFLTWFVVTVYLLLRSAERVAAPASGAAPRTTSTA